MGNLFRLAIATKGTGPDGAYTLQGGSRLDIEMDERESPQRFDFARYELGSLGHAIGLRTPMLGCGAGGTLCSTEHLTLIVTNPAPRVVMRAPVASYLNAAGDWHREGTRDHFVEELEAVVVIGKHSADAAPVITVRRRRKGRWAKQVYVAQKAERTSGSLVYKTRDEPVVLVVD